MKKMVILLQLVFSGALSMAQITYQNYLDNTVRWSYEFLTGGAGNSYYEFSEYNIKGDTLIDSIWYWNVWKRSKTIYNGVRAETALKPFFGLRETPDKFFFQYLYSTNTETVMNDFNLELGDTLQNDGYGTFLVDYIDTITFGNDKRLLYRSIYPCGVVEGIGFIARNGSFNSKMVCFQKQDNIYPSSSAACGFTSNADVLDDWPPLSWYPNPARTEIRIDFPSDLVIGELHYRWYTLSGILHSQGNIQNPSGFITLSTTDKSPGFYTLMLGDKSKWLPMRILVIP